MKKLIILIIVVIIILGGLYFFTRQESNDPFSDCSVTDCRDNVSHVCCDCEVDGPSYFIKTDTKESLANCGRNADDLCQELWTSCIKETL